MAEARDIISGLKVKNIKFLAGEHDAGLDNGDAFKECFGATHYTFDHKGVHFIAIDNVSDPTSSITDPQLQWLKCNGFLWAYPSGESHYDRHYLSSFSQRINVPPARPVFRAEARTDPLGCIRPL
jgi:hypothetical protein